MVDFYFVTSVINMFWQILTILFVLYRFTSFFSLIYNFIKFIGKMLQVFVYMKNEITLYFRKRSGYSVLNQDEIDNLPSSRRKSPKTIFKKIYDWFYNKKTLDNDRLPLYETRTSYCDINNISLLNLNKSRTNIDDINLHRTKQSKNDIDFENHMHSYLSCYTDGDTNKDNHTNTDSDTNTNSDNEDGDYNDDNVGFTDKPFNVESSNMLFNSEFLKNIFTNTKKKKSIQNDVNLSLYKREDDIEVRIESEYELRRSLLNNQD